MVRQGDGRGWGKAPPLDKQRGMGKSKPRGGLKDWRDLLIQAIGLIEDEAGVPWEESVLHKRRIKARESGK